jgi:hypothetical protein
MNSHLVKKVQGKYSKHFILFVNNPNKPHRYITLGLKGLPGTNTLAYWAIHKLRRKLSVVNTVQGVITLTLVLLNFKTTKLIHGMP